LFDHRSDAEAAPVKHWLIPKVRVRGDEGQPMALARPFGRSEFVSRSQRHFRLADQLDRKLRFPAEELLAILSDPLE
jgi:hypothetical protein